MDQPADYSGAFSTLPDPAQSFTQGLQSGANLQQVQMAQRMQQIQLARQQSMWQATQQVAQNPTLQNVSQLSIAFPEISENLKRSFDMLQPAQQQAKLQDAIPVYAAFQSGRPDVAQALLRQHAQALQNSGQADEAQHTLALANLVDTDPGHAQTMAGLALSSALGPDKFQSMFSSIPGTQTGLNSVGANTQENQAKADLATANAMTQLDRNRAEIGQINANVTNQAGRLQLDRDQLMSNTQLKLQELNLQYGKPPDSVRPVIDQAMTDAAAAEQGANRYLDLANRIESMPHATGGPGIAADAWKAATQGILGFDGQDQVSALKNEYTRIVNNQTLSAAKDALGGRVTDTDMKVAMGPVPNINSSPEVVASYLRGTAKLQQLAAAQAQAKGEWLAQSGQSGNLGRASTDMSIMGTRVPAGSNFADFSRQFMKQKAEQIAQQAAIVNAQGRGYMKHANGAALQGDGIPVLTGNPPVPQAPAPPEAPGWAGGVPLGG